MFILGDEDWRTPPSAGGEELFRALKYLKRPTGDGALPRREPRALAQRPSLAPRRTPAAHRRLVRQILTIKHVGARILVGAGSSDLPTAGLYRPPGFGRVGSGSAADRIGSHSPAGLIRVTPTGIGSLSV